MVKISDFVLLVIALILVFASPRLSNFLDHVEHAKTFVELVLAPLYLLIFFRGGMD